MSSFLKPAPAVRPLRVPALHSANSQAKDKRAVEPTVFAGHFAPTGVRASDMCLPHNIYIYIHFPVDTLHYMLQGTQQYFYNKDCSLIFSWCALRAI